MCRPFILFQENPELLKTERLMLDSSFGGKCQCYIRLSYDSKSRRETSSPCARVGVTLHSHYSECFTAGGPLPSIFGRESSRTRQLKKSSAEKLNSILVCANENKERELV